MLKRGFRPEDLKPQRKKKTEPEPEEQSKPAEKSPPSPVVSAAARTVGNLVELGVKYAIEQRRESTRIHSDILKLARARMGILTIGDTVRDLSISTAAAEKHLVRMVNERLCTFAVARNDQEIFIFAEFLPRLWACEHCDQKSAEARSSCSGCGAPLVETVCKPELKQSRL